MGAHVLASPCVGVAVSVLYAIPTLARRVPPCETFLTTRCVVVPTGTVALCVQLPQPLGEEVNLMTYPTVLLMSTGAIHVKVASYMPTTPVAAGARARVSERGTTSLTLTPIVPLHGALTLDPIERITSIPVVEPPLAQLQMVIFVGDHVVKRVHTNVLPIRNSIALT